ncbi:MAG: DUF1844 domain-containing protein [Nitrospirae bacterium]|nr:DUF1844 domain-containing protein [Nitrospirota bacterium]
MRCPACGHEEKIGDVCSQCATPLPVVEEKAAPAAPSPPKQPVAPPPPPTPKEGKHRARPLHDLDLTLPELEVQHLESPDPNPQKEPEAEKPSFKVTDRRGRFENETVQSGPAPKPETGPAAGSQTGPRPGGPLDFSSFIYSMGASALMAMGDAQLPGLPSAQGSARPVDLSQARELIDLLGLLEEKTKGNLTPEEAELLQQTLYTLRTRFIQASKKT